MQKISHQTQSFDGFTLDLTRGCLLRGTEEINLPPKPFDALKYLVANPGRLISKAELMEVLWPDTAVTPDSLVQCIGEVRLALGDKDQEIIKNVPRRGYIFDREVRDYASSAPVTTYTEETGVQLIIEEEETDDRGVLEVPTLAASRNVGLLPAHRATGIERVTTVIRQHKLRAALSVLTLVVAVAAILYFSRPGEAIDSIAVMPFVNGNGDTETEYLSDGITESLINQLSRLPNLKVMSRNSVFRYQRRQVDAHVVGRELSVRAVLMGRIEQRGDSLSISVELVDARDNSHIWGEHYDRKLSDILSVQREITQGLTDKLRLALTDTEQKLVNKRYTENAEAYQLYLKGRYFWNKRTGAFLPKAVEYFNQAVAVDQAYAPAYAGLADCYSLYSTYEVSSPNDSFPKAKAAALKAVALDETLAEAHTSLAFVLYHYEWDWAGADREFRRAIELNPKYTTAHHWYGEYLGAVGRFDDAVAEYRVALQLDPLSFIINNDFGYALYLARQYEQAVAQLHKALELEPNSPIIHYTLSRVYQQQGKYAEAAREYLTALQADGFSTQQISLPKETFAAKGYEELVRLRLKSTWRNVYTQRFRTRSNDLAVDYAFLRDTSQAFTWLQKAFDENDADLVFLNVNPAFDNLRSDPRFADLLRRMKLSP